MLASTVRLAAAHFGLVFGAGFVLGVLRTLLVAPAIGERDAELVELPLMLVVVFLSARFVTRRWAAALTLGAVLAAGGAALALMLACEVGVVVGLRDQSLGEHVASRDPVAGSAYLASLVVFALAPWFVERRRRRRRPPEG